MDIKPLGFEDVPHQSEKRYKIQLIAQSYSPQELFAALVWQRRFNEFDGKEVITDLSNHPSLWASFLFTKPIFAPDENGLSFGGVIDTLLAMANYRPIKGLAFVQFPHLYQVFAQHLK